MTGPGARERLTLLFERDGRGEPAVRSRLEKLLVGGGRECERERPKDVFLPETSPEAQTADAPGPEALHLQPSRPLVRIAAGMLKSELFGWSAMKDTPTLEATRRLDASHDPELRHLVRRVDALPLLAEPCHCTSCTFASHVSTSCKRVDNRFERRRPALRIQGPATDARSQRARLQSPAGMPLGD